MAVGKAQKAPIERSASREDESLLLLSVLATATRAVAVSAARHDAGGRVHTPSPFFGDLQRTAGVTVERVGSDPLARSRRLPPRGPERTLRAAARAHTGGPTHDPALASVIARADVELRRQEFFAAPGQTGGTVHGRIDHDPALVERLELARWAGFERPLDTTTLERAARCGFKAFALEVLKHRGAPRHRRDPRRQGARAPAAQAPGGRARRPEGDPRARPLRALDGPHRGPRRGGR
jgi:hypothetical protein